MLLWLFFNNKYCHTLHKIEKRILLNITIILLTIYQLIASNI